MSNGLPDLSRMKDAEYKLLSSRQLSQYNNELPSIDYAKPYQHQPYPAVRYRVIMVNGQKMLEDIECPDEITDKALKKDGWKNTPGDWGVETHPSAAPLSRRRSIIPVPVEEAEAAPAAPASGVQFSKSA